MEDININYEEMNAMLLSKIRQYQNSIIKHSELGNDTKILSYLQKLYDMPITVSHLEETGIGRTINSLRKYSGDVGSASKAIVSKWKEMVAREEEESPRTPSPTNQEMSQSSSSPEPVSESKKKKSEHKHSSEDRHSKKYHSNDVKKSKSSERNSNKSKSELSKSHHRKEEKRNSEKSSHSKEKEHKSSNSSDSRKSDKYRHDKKRKHEEDRPSKKKKYDESDSGDSNQLLIQENSIDSLSHDEDISNIDDYRETARLTNTDELPSTSSSSHKKHHKSDKHRNRQSDSDHRKVENGEHSTSSKKSSHRDKNSEEACTTNYNNNNNKEKRSSNKSSPDSKSSKSNSSKKPKSEKVKKLLTNDNGIDSGSGASFAEALGMIEPPKTKNVFKKKSSNSTSSSPVPSTSSLSTTTTTTKSPKTSKSITQPPLIQNPPTNLLSSNIKLEPLELNIVSHLPEITTNYKPLGHYNYDSSSPANNIKNLTEDEALSVVISSKTQRTKVFSGNKTNWGQVPSLFQLCVRILQDNIDALEYTGGVPYTILKAVLERANANQLLNTEYHNPYLVEDTDELWEKHCRRECRGSQRQEHESWREMYLRCRDERAAKLKALTVNIKQSIDKSLPVRQTKLAYVDNYVKPPRAIARKQAKYGTDNKNRPLITPTARLNSIASGSGENNRVTVPNPGARAMSSTSASSIKPKKAPLMQKTLALMKGRFGRR